MIFVVVVLSSKIYFLCSGCSGIHLCLFPTGGHSGLCPSLQRHVRVLGAGLPGGRHMSGASMLLGCH